MLTPRRRDRGLVALLVALVVFLGTESPASAHTGFESSDPADGQVIDQPVAEISVTFSGEATPAGEGFVVLDPSGTVREPDEVSTVDNLTWTLHFDEPLAGGVVGVRWQVAAPDAHPIDGSFSFTVSAEPAEAIAAPEVSTEEPASPASTSTVAAAEAVEPVEPEPSVATTATGDVDESESPPSRSNAIDGDSIDLESFLDTDPDTAAGASWLYRLSRTLRLIGAVGAIGGAVFATFVLRGDARDVHAVLTLVRRAGVLLVLGSIGAAVAQAATVERGWSELWSLSAWSDTLWSSLGLAFALRFVGGALIVTGTKLDTHDSTSAWQPTSSPLALGGIGLVVASFLFDGHTVSEGPRWLHAITNVIHVASAATWAGGVVMLALAIARRKRNNAASPSLPLAVRFSVVATIALVAAGIAGVVLSVVILDSPSQLWSTPWGQVLIVKVALVALAGVGGAYNHKVIVPALERSPQDATVAHRFGWVVTLEAVTLLAVTITTALLIGASAV